MANAEKAKVIFGRAKRRKRRNKTRKKVQNRTERTSIKIKTEENGSTPILFPVSEELTISDLRSAFPYAASLRYQDEDDGHYHHVLCRGQKFVEPDGGWFKENRIYLAILESRNNSAGSTRFESFQSYRQQLNASTANRSSQRSSKRTHKAMDESLTVNITVGHGHFQNGNFSKISVTNLSLCGGLVSVGPFPKDGNTADDIKQKAHAKFSAVNRRFRQMYQISDEFYLVYPDGTKVDKLPDNSGDFSISGYRDFLNPHMKYSMIRLYLCKKDNFHHNITEETVEITTDSSSDEELPEIVFSSGRTSNTYGEGNENETQPHDEEEKSIIVTVDFSIGETTVTENFPNNSRVSALVTYIKAVMKYDGVITLQADHKVLSADDRLVELFGENVENINISVETTNCETTDNNELENIGNILADYNTDETWKVDDIVRVLVNETKHIEEPVRILSLYVQKFLCGRDLDVQDDTTCFDIEGETSAIFVGRNSIFEDATSEIQNLHNIRYPLEVTFYGECAEDYGGPRKEFFSLFMDEIKEKLLNEEGKLVHNSESIAKKAFYASGIIAGLSVLQGGPCPQFINAVLQQEDKEEVTQFKHGLARTGILQILRQKPTVSFLFHHSQSARLTVAKLLNLLSPNFREQGSSTRVLEEETYSRFVKYIRQVAAGRRGPLTMENILQFVTGCKEEPVLGFSMKPCVSFSELPGNLPTASTCINKLMLPIKTNLNEENLFEVMDLAFSNTYFGLQ